VNGDFCYACDGTGERDFLSGAKCYHCDGTGWRDDFDEDLDEYLDDGPQCDVCGGAGDVPTADYESYFGAQMKPCPRCHGTLDGLGHGKLS